MSGCTGRYLGNAAHPPVCFWPPSSSAVASGRPAALRRPSRRVGPSREAQAQPRQEVDLSSTTAQTTAGSAPPELVGRWRAILAPGDSSVLTLSESSYSIARVGSGSGPITVDGDVIRFFRSSLCNGIGEYRWSIEGDLLRLESVEADECPGRADALDGQTYTRLD